MTAKEKLAGSDVEMRRFEYEDSTVIAVDFGQTGDESVDIVGDTVIVVADGEQYDLEIEGSAEALIKNGILTIEVSG